MRAVAMLGMIGAVPVAVIAVVAGNLAVHPVFATSAGPNAAKGEGIEVLGALVGLGAVTCFVGLAGRWRVPAAAGAAAVALATGGLLYREPFDDVIRLSNWLVVTTLIALLAVSLIALWCSFPESKSGPRP